MAASMDVSSCGFTFSLLFIFILFPSWMRYVLNLGIQRRILCPGGDALFSNYSCCLLLVWAEQPCFGRSVPMEAMLIPMPAGDGLGLHVESDSKLTCFYRDTPP